MDEINNLFNIPEEVLASNVSANIIFPKALPFSKGLPQTAGYVKEMISQFYKFAQGFAQQNHEIDDLLRKTLENLLQGINNAYASKIENSGLTVVYQLMTNLSFYESACDQFEMVIIEKKHSFKHTKNQLFAVKLFHETRLAAEQQIHSLINRKIENFLELVDYDWKIQQPRRQASSHLNGIAFFTIPPNQLRFRFDWILDYHHDIHTSRPSSKVQSVFVFSDL